MSTLSRVRSDDSGQLAIMIIGFAVIVMMFVTLIANTSKAFLWRRSLSSWADAAALAATQTAGEDVIFDGGLAGNLPVDEAAAEAFVVDYLDRQHLAQRYPDLSVDVAVDQSTSVVTVTLSATMPLAFVNDVTDSFGEGVPIEGSASAVARSAEVPSIDVAARDYDTEIKALSQTLTGIESVLDLPKLRAQLADLQQQAAAPDLWDDVDRAQKVNSKLSSVQADLRKVEDMRRRVDDLSIMLELAADEADEDAFAELDSELDDVHRLVSDLEVRTLLSGEYDAREALVTIRAEAGGVDAADFAEMLLRMYMRWAERHGYKTDVWDTSYAEEAGIKSATFAVHSPYAYGTLSIEQGTHRLVRISPFDNQGRRQTSFAGVEVLPVVEQTDHVEIADDDLRIDVFRSSGPGGQGVNTTDSAVRITHLPTGIVVSCQNERSQLQNKARAMEVLQAKLLERRRQEEQARLNALKGDSGGSWGNQMRSYVLHPYQMVKDLRTEYEVGNPQAVFDGDLDGFIEAGIRWRRQTVDAT